MKFIFLLLFLLISTTAQAATYWVSKSSNGSQHCVNSATPPANLSTGTSATIAQGIACLSSGDTLYIMGGTYFEGFGSDLSPLAGSIGTCTRGDVCVPNGSPSAWTKIHAAPGHERLVTVNSLGNTTLGFGGPVRYIEVKGLRLTPDRTNAGSLSSSRAAGAGCWFNQGTQGFHCAVDGQPTEPAYPMHLLLENNELFDCSKSCVFGWGEVSAPGVTTIVSVPTADIIIRNNDVHDCGSDGFDHCLYVGGKNIVENNRIWNSAGNGIQGQDVGSYYGSNGSHIRGNLIWNVSNGITVQEFNKFIYNNIIYRTGSTECLKWLQENGQPCQLGLSGEGSGIHALGAIGGMVANNTVFNMAIAIKMGFDSSQISYRNNTCVACSLNATGGGVVQGIFEIFQDQGDVRTNNLAVPQSALLNPGGGNFQIASGTGPLTNTGTNVHSNIFSTDASGTIRPQGSAWDVGACEWFNGAPQCPNFASITPPSNPPIITITSPSSNPTFTVTSATGNVSGSASAVSPATVGKVTWTCATCTPTSGTATGTTVWSVTGFTWQVGINQFDVVVTDSNGLTSSDSISVTYQPIFPGNALVGAWGFEDGSGTTTVDSSGNLNTGFLTNGPTWSTNGKFGKAIQYDGVNDYVLVQDANSLDLTQSFTLSGWFFPTAVHTDWRAGIVKNYVQYLYVTNGGSGSCTSGAVLGGYASEGQNKFICQSVGNAIPVGTWTHLAIAYDAATSTLSLYRNGVQVVTATLSGLMIPSTGSLQIGASTFGENFEGLIDEVRVYNWKIPLTAGSNTVPGAACVFGNPLDIAQQSIVRDMNCPVIQTGGGGIPQVKLPASATGLKIGPGASALKFGSKAP